MKIAQSTIGALTLNTPTLAKFATLQKSPYYLTVTSFSGDGLTANVDMSYISDPTDSAPFQTKQLQTTLMIFLITLSA